jgi:hypothetical protein
MSEASRDDTSNLDLVSLVRKRISPRRLMFNRARIMELNSLKGKSQDEEFRTHHGS